MKSKLKELTKNELADRLDYCVLNTKCFVSKEPLKEGWAFIMHPTLEVQVPVNPEYVK